jgi:hypothetical protein
VGSHRNGASGLASVRQRTCSAGRGSQAELHTQMFDLPDCDVSAKYGRSVKGERRESGPVRMQRGVSESCHSHCLATVVTERKPRQMVVADTAGDVRAVVVLHTGGPADWTWHPSASAERFLYSGDGPSN